MLVSSLDDSDSMPGGELSTTAGHHGGHTFNTTAGP